MPICRPLCTMKPKNNKILEDHKRQGKKLVPPLLLAIGEGNFSYVKNGIPEVIWIALLNKKLGLAFGAQLAQAFAKSIYELKISDEIPYNISWFNKLSDQNVHSIQTKLRNEHLYDELNSALIDLLNTHPECPLNRIFEGSKMTSENVETLKTTLVEVYDKRSKGATLTLANAIAILNTCGVLRVTKSSELPNPNCILDYPNTEDSIRLAAFVRATSNAMLSEMHIPNGELWTSYFWNRNLEIEPCLI